MGKLRKKGTTMCSTGIEDTLVDVFRVQEDQKDYEYNQLGRAEANFI